MKQEDRIKAIHDALEKEWRQAKAERVAKIHNRLILVLAEEQAHIDEVIIAMELLLQETLEAKKKIIETQRNQLALSRKTPSKVE